MSHLTLSTYVLCSILTFSCFFIGTVFVSFRTTVVKVDTIPTENNGVECKGNQNRFCQCTWALEFVLSISVFSLLKQVCNEQGG